MPCLNNTRSDFSMGRSIINPKTIAKTAKEMGYDSVVMCDDWTISGMTHLFTACKEQDIKAICGINIKVYDDPAYRPPSKKSGEVAKDNNFWEAKLLVKNEIGLKAVFRLMSLANSEAYFYYTPRIGLKELIIALKSDGLLLLTGDFDSLFTHKNANKIYDALAKYVDSHNRFIELIPVKSAYFDKTNKIAAQKAIETRSQTIYSRPALYLQGQDKARDVMSYIINNSSAKHRLRSEPFNRDLHIMNLTDQSDEIIELAKRVPEIEGLSDFTQAIVDSCHYEWAQLDMCLPKMAENEFEELTLLCREGWKTRLSKLTYGYKPDASLLPQYAERLKYELKILKSMGFDRYFLLVRDVIMWCKTNDILVGPARGSAAGSLVAYLVGITDVDPLRFNLIFERFLNPDRLDYPDIDTDFMSSRRGEVIQYMTDKYGSNRVAGISNFTSLGSASAIRDTGRIYEVPLDDLRCTKAIREANTPMTDVLELAEIQAYGKQHPLELKVATELDGTMRGLGRHAAGVVVAGEDLENRCVVERRKGDSVVNWDKRTVEGWGLIKLDILGLSTLDTLSIIKKKLAKRGVSIEWENIPLDDKETLDNFGQGKTVGVFQFTSGGMRSLLKNLASGGRGLTFDEVSAATALYRPGPLQSGMTEEYVRLKQGHGSPHYPHPNTEAALLETRGVIIYQEQVMQIARDLCGFTMGEADLLRKAIGKKSAALIASQRDKFIDGAVTTSAMDRDKAEELFDEIEKFAAYSFNKSHSVAYTLISYLCMYIKTHYPAEFFASSLSIAGEDELRTIVKDALEYGLVVLPPDINVSTKEFEIGYDSVRECQVLYAPLNRVKMVSDKGADAIIEARETVGEFTSIAQFEKTVNRRACNKRAISNLDTVGAFARVEAGQIDPRHPDRLKDQKELIPGLMLNNVKADRKMVIDGHIAALLRDTYTKIQSLEEDEYGDPTGINVALPIAGKKPSFVVITDYPAYSECEAKKFATGKSFNYILGSLKNAKIKKSDGYYTGVLKAKRKDNRAGSSTEEINLYKPYLLEELDILKPAVIVALGGAAARAICPEIHGGWEELAGQVVYDVKRDCSVIFGPNPQMIYAKPDVQNVLDEVFMEVAEMIN